ncbi:DUF4097 family beta strand repeat-containing protein [Fructilactobacillus vespulae]|uniref:DUF4097 family beta strand repeat-containing protein n=1 Tax=Fructilactobacillus vespulae TaxID=1249630 RepID=UPI0039B5ACDE
MKNTILTSVKWVLLIGLVVGAIFGCLYLWASSTNNRINVNHFKIDHLDKFTFSSDKKQVNLKLSTRTANLNITEGNEFKIVLNDAVKSDYKFSEQENNIKLVQKDAHSHQLEIGNTPTINIQVPKNQIDNYDIYQLNGTIQIKQLVANKATIQHDNGTTNLTDFSVHNGGTLNKKNGSTNLSNVAVAGIKAKVDNGNISVSGDKKGKSYQTGNTPFFEINSGQGQIKIK